jgi:hypothetical protein
MKGRSDTIQHKTEQIKKNNGNIESSFEKLLKWRENEHLRVLNLAEQCDSVRQYKLQVDNEDTESEVISQTRTYKITIIKQ